MNINEAIKQELQGKIMMKASTVSPAYMIIAESYATEIQEGFGRVTHCILLLGNNLNVTGESTYLGNYFDRKLAQKMARESAISNIQPSES